MAASLPLPQVGLCAPGLADKWRALPTSGQAAVHLLPDVQLFFVVAIFNLISEILHLDVLLLYAGVSSFTRSVIIEPSG